MMNNIFNYIQIIILLIFPLIITNDGKRKESLQIDENIFMKICQLKFCKSSHIAKCNIEKCMQNLLLTNKLGECPERPTTLFEEICENTCGGLDYRCPGTHKCCKNSCGQTCQSTQGLTNISDKILPPIPQNITLTSFERYQRRSAEIQWAMEWLNKRSYSVIYVVEALILHIGNTFSMQKSEDNWFSVNMEISSAQGMKGQKLIKLSGTLTKLRLGRWYQFRISAINENGTRGYSVPSERFILNERPRNPLAPTNFSIEQWPRLLDNNSIYTKVVWNQQKPDYPIEKYKISWALYLQANPNGSLLYNEAYVKESTRYFEFWNLKPDSVYYIQIQALSIYGKRRLKSPKVPLLLNTTITESGQLKNLHVDHLTDHRSVLRLKQSIRSNHHHHHHHNHHHNQHHNLHHPHPHHHQNRQVKSNLEIRFIGSKKYGMIVRLIWIDQFYGSFVELCVGDLNCLGKSMTKDKIVRTKKNHYDFIDLKFATKYAVRIKNLPMHDISKTFTTPTCNNFKQKHPAIIFNCS